MRKYTLLLFMLVSSMTLMSQNYTIGGVEYLRGDMSARENIKLDDKDRQCAVFRISTRGIPSELKEGFYFECDYASNVVQRVIKGGEIFVWVSPGIKTLKIQHNQLGAYDLHLSKYLKSEVEPLRTYKILIEAVTVEQPEVEVTEQFLEFRITPKDALLEVNSQAWILSKEGVARKLLKFGTYDYSVQAPNYHPVNGTVEVNDTEEVQTVDIDLMPNFGWIEVPDIANIAGANVYIDNALIGNAPCKSGPLKSGMHTVKIVKEMYDTYNETVEVLDDETYVVSHTLTGNFAFVSLKVDADAEIWVNNEKKGVGTWKGDMPIGTCKIECKLEGHETSTTSMEITKAMNGTEINLKTPVPLYGSLNVDCTPDFCSIFIDDVEIGTTPKLIGKVLVGKHTLRITRNGYDEYQETIEIKNGERTDVLTVLIGGQTVTQSPKSEPVTTKVTKSGNKYYYGGKELTLNNPIINYSPYISKNEFARELKKFNRRSALFGSACGFLTGAFIGGLIINKQSDDFKLGKDYFVTTGVTAGALWIVCFTINPSWNRYLKSCYEKHNRKVDEVIKQYKEDDPSRLSFSVGVNSNGVGVTMSF